MTNVLIALFSLLVFFIFPQQLTYAHQPRIVESTTVKINNPEVSQAFYGEFKGAPVEFNIKSDKPFKLYVGLLVPDIPNVQKNISAEIYRLKNGTYATIAFLDGSNFNWTPFFEDFAKDNYFWGPEYKASDSIKGKELIGKLVSAGDYQIKVFSPSNSGKYVLVTGFLELFPFSEIINASIIVPRLKAQFFDYPLPVLVSSQYVLSYLLVVYVLAFVAGFIYRLIVRKLAKSSVRKAHKNIGKTDRLIRAAIGIVLFLYAVTTSWNPILFFLSGLVLFEAIFSWCGLYQALGKNTCPIN